MDTPSCRHCAGALEYLGILGRLLYGRCRQCGLLTGLPVCHECYGHGTLWDEASGAYEYCPECGGSGARETVGA